MECLPLEFGMNRRKRLVLARDRLGKKPLYYSLMNGTFLFASELKAILAYPHFLKAGQPSLFYEVSLF